MFGPERFTRTSGSPNVFDETITVDGNDDAPFTLRVINGNANGSNRVSAATIDVNGAQVAGPSDFGTSVPGFDRRVALNRNNNALRIRLTSSPGSFLTLSVCGN
jgi:hypothetical protein